MFILIKYDDADNIQCSLRFPWPLPSSSETNEVEDQDGSFSHPPASPAFAEFHSQPRSPDSVKVMAKPTASVDNFDLYRPPAQVCFTKELLQSLFCLPLKEAAMATRVSVTTFKRMCRKHGVKAWPFRFQAALTRARSPISPTHLPSVVSSIKEANPVIMITSTVSAQVPHSDVQTQAHKIQAHICLDMANMMSVDSELEHSRAFSIPPTTEGRDAPASPANDGFEIVQHQDSSRKQTMQIAFEAFDELLPTLSSAADGFGSSCEVSLCHF